MKRRDGYKGRRGATARDEKKKKSKVNAPENQRLYPHVQRNNEAREQHRRAHQGHRQQKRETTPEPKGTEGAAARCFCSNSLPAAQDPRWPSLCGPSSDPHTSLINQLTNQLYGIPHPNPVSVTGRPLRFEICTEHLFNPVLNIRRNTASNFTLRTSSHLPEGTVPSQSTHSIQL